MAKNKEKEVSINVSTGKRNNKNKRKNKSRNKNTKNVNMQRGSTVFARNDVLAKTSMEYGYMVGIAQHLCSKVNPFCPEARGAKWDDISSSYTIPYQARYIAPLTGTAAGDGGFTSPLIPSKLHGEQSTTSGGVITAWSSSTDPNYSNMQTLYFDYRIVSAGIKYQTNQSWSTATGIMQCGATNYDCTSTTTINVGNLLNAVDSTAFAVRDAQFYFICKPTNTQASNFIAIAGPTYSWTMPLLTYQGTGNAQTFGFVEIVVNYEMHPNVQTVATTQGITKASIASNFVNTATDAIRNSLPTVLNMTEGQVDSTVMAEAIKQVKSASYSTLRDFIVNVIRA